MKTRQIHGLGLGEFLIFAPAKEMLKSAYFFSALAIAARFFVAEKSIESRHALLCSRTGLRQSVVALRR